MIFPAIAIHQLMQTWKTPDEENVLRAVLAVMCAVSFGVISHVWTWYIVWTLPLAALVPGWWVSRFVVGVALFLPFTAAAWWIDNIEDYKDVAALMMYGAAIIWTVATARPSEEEEREALPAGTIDFALAKGKVASKAAMHRMDDEYASDMRLAAKAAASGKN